MKAFFAFVVCCLAFIAPVDAGYKMKTKTTVRGGAVAAYADPFVSVQAAPMVSVPTPVLTAPAPVVQYSAPVVQYSAPIVQYSAPIVTYSAPAATVRVRQRYAVQRQTVRVRAGGLFCP